MRVDGSIGSVRVILSVMNRALIVSVVLLSCGSSPPRLVPPMRDACAACAIPDSPPFDPERGFVPADTGDRQVIRVEDFTGDDYQRLYLASQAAIGLHAAVVLDQRCYELYSWINLHPGVMYTGGCVRRAAGASSFHLMRAATTLPYPSGIVIDSILFDGNWRAGGWPADWRLNNALGFRGVNTLRNSAFIDSPSEGILTCGATLEGNYASGIAGSFIHKSCADGQQAPDTLTGNTVIDANILGDAVLGHSEGLITLSANAGDIYLEGNVFARGGEGVYGLAGPDDEDIVAVGDCYEDFPRLIELYAGADPAAFDFSRSTLVRVGTQ